MWPCMASLWSHWAPPAERSFLIGFSNAGSQIGILDFYITCHFRILFEIFYLKVMC